MRVLAIRGRNLASLAGDFTIDFTTEPLASSGIFAITGPTGAGKSTLLDALCLALYGEIPRLRAAPPSGRIGADDNSLSLGDPRAILRHGTGEGFAEVDFAVGGATYRARWSIKRARGKANGRFQNNEHTFERIDTAERLGGTRTETRAAIQQVIGLNAEQFGRAVLLAQGDFEAFVRADANDRALLLERLTGSDIYARLGQCAYARAKAHEAGIEDLKLQIAAQNGLDDEQRILAEATRDQALAAEQQASAALAVLKEARRWEETEASLAARLAEALATADQTDTTRLAAEPRRAALERARAAARLIPAWQAAAEAERQAIEAAGTVERAEQALAKAGDARVAAEADEQAARAAHAECCAEHAKLSPALTQARALDVQLASATEHRDAARSEAAKRREAAATANESAEQAAAALASAAHNRQAAQDWLESRAALGEAALRRAELATQLADRVSATATLAHHAAERASHEVAQQQALNRWTTATAALEKATDAHGSAVALLQTVEAALPPDSRMDELTGLRERLLAIQTMTGAEAEARKRWAAAEEGLARTRKQLESAADEHERTETRVATLGAQLPELVARLSAAREKLAFLAAAAGDAATTLRASLLEGEPCPVCGSADHRLDIFADSLDQQLRPLRAEVAQLESEQADLTNAHGQALIDAAALAERLDGLRRQLATQLDDLKREGRALERASGALRDAAVAEGLTEDGEALADATAARIAGVDAERNALTSAREACTRARNAEQQARKARDEATREHGEARDALAHASRTLEDCERDCTITQQRADQLAIALDRWLASLGDWRAIADPAAWLAGECAAWDQHQAARDRLERDLPALRDAAARSESMASAARQSSAEAEQRLAEAERTHGDLAGLRSALLGGEAVAAVEQRLAAAGKSAEQAVSAAARFREEAAGSALAAQVRVGECRKHLAEATTARAERRKAFTRALAAAGLAEGEVAQVAAQGEAALEAEAEALVALDRAAGTNRALADQRERDLAAHRNTNPPEQRGEELASAIDEAEGTHAAAAGIRQEAELRLQMDDKVRERTAALRAELERKSAEADVWLRLNALIGDSTGAGFRRFAQGLTLERLLVHANARMAELKPRFTLERGTGGEMLIQVIDNDMGGEVRGLHNLSGGERFLVSLALALGLAEMSTSGGVRIESLFIDEGFGALDPASLGHAVALLEQLHATGRRVGVISHVEELKERIPVKIEVTPSGRGTSGITVVGG